MLHVMHGVRLLVVFSLSGFAFAQEGLSKLEMDISSMGEPASEKIAYEFALDIKSGYLDVNGFMNSRDPVVQPDLMVTFPNHCYMDLWASAGIGSQLNNDYDDEVDFLVGWSKELENNVSFDTNLGYIDLIPLEWLRDEDADAFQLELSLTKSFELSESASLSPYVKTQTLVSPNGDSIPWQTYSYVGLEHEWALNDKWSLGQNAYVLHDPGIYDLDDGLIGAYQGSLSFAISESIAWRPIMVEAATPITVDDERETEFVIGTGFTFGG